MASLVMHAGVLRETDLLTVLTHTGSREWVDAYAGFC